MVVFHSNLVEKGRQVHCSLLAQEVNKFLLSVLSESGQAAGSPLFMGLRVKYGGVDGHNKW